MPRATAGAPMPRAARVSKFKPLGASSSSPRSVARSGSSGRTSASRPTYPKPARVSRRLLAPESKAQGNPEGSIGPTRRTREKPYIGRRSWMEKTHARQYMGSAKGCGITVSSRMRSPGSRRTPSDRQVPGVLPQTHERAAAASSGHATRFAEIRPGPQMLLQSDQTARR
jgi:hypothetical protein